MFPTAWWRARARARVCAFVGAHVSVCACCANGHALNAPWRCVGVRPHSGSCTLGKHPRACVCRIQQPYPRSRAFSARSAHRTCMHKTRQIRPIAGLAGGWIAATRIVRCVILAPINLPRPRNLPRRRLSSRAERCQKPKSAPDDAPVRLRAGRRSAGRRLALPNLDERRRLARSRAGELHAVVYDGPIPPKCAGACRRAALGGGRLQEFRHYFWQKLAPE